MKIYISILLTMIMSVSAFAGESVNSKESIRVCKQALNSDLTEGHSLKFKRKTATSVDAESFKHWINVTEISADDKQSLKVLCQTSRTGELLELSSKPGRWNF